MTRINKLVLHGFKSFAKRTELLFGPDFNCVLGPNGSGKSNILDALCFVLGKSSAKALRSEKSANLIYNGGKAKKPSNSGYVSIYFNNENSVFPTEEKEVKLTRLIKANGQSVYKINDERRTRQQILDLMALAKVNPDGYNIIMQGDIVGFVEMQPEERRKLVEEISGISIYEEKKQKAVNELNRVEERLKEALIILTERKTYLKELGKEREQAIKFKHLNDKIKTNKASLLYKQIERKTEEKNKFEERIAKQRNSLTEKQEEIKKLKEQISEHKNEIDSINKEIESKGEKEQIELHKEVEKLKVDLGTARNKIDSHKNEIERISERKKQLDKNLEEINGKIKSLEEEKKATQKEVDGFKKEQDMINERISGFKKKYQLDNIGDIEKQIEEIDSGAEDMQKNILAFRQEQQELLREKDKIEFQVAAIDEKMEKVLAIEKENEDQIKDLKQKKKEFKKATLELTQLVNKDSSLAAQLGNARKSVLHAEEQLSRLSARNIGIQEKISGDTALKEILKQKKDIPGIYGTVSELGNVSSKHALALEIAAGNKIKSIVVSDDKTAARCINFLKERKLGIATFLPLNKIKPITIKPEVKDLAKSNGSHGFAIDLISYDHQFKNVFSYVFGNTLVIEGIDTARRMGIGKARMVTTEGDLVSVSGAMEGGYRGKKRPGLGFQEKELNKEIEGYESRVSDSHMLISRLEKEKEGNEETIVNLRELKAHLEGDIIKVEKSLNLDSEDLDVSKKLKDELKQKINKSDREIDDVSQKISDLNKDLAENKMKKQELRNKVSEVRNPTVLAELNAFEEKKRELSENMMKMQGDSANIDSQIDNVLTPEKNNLSKVSNQQNKEYDDFNSEIKNLKESIDEINSQLKEKEKSEKEFYSQFKGLFSKRTNIDDNVKKFESQVEKLNEQEKKFDHGVNAIALDSARVKTELAGLEKEFEDYKDVEVNKNKSEPELRKEIGIAEGTITRIGSVNMKSLEIYETAEKEYEKLTGKREKLGLEKEDVLMMMNEIDMKKKELFMKTFDGVNSNFQSIFSSLSRKGEASLVLENPESPFDAGLLIKVKMAGKRFMDIRSLSGGEKTMTALSFIFSIQEFEPASFYVLDEVDAALDKHNSGKLSELIKKYSSNAQYIMISHNDGVIAEASNLYGVSMNEHGISNVVSLKI